MPFFNVPTSPARALKPLICVTIAVLIGWLSALPTSFAEEVVELYDYRIIVESQQQSELQQAIQDGFAEILVRASGQRRVLTDSSVIRELRRADDYYVSYAYEEAQIPVDSGDEGVLPQTKPAWRLVIKYSGQMVQSLLRDLGLAFWPPRRPNTLVWMVMDRGSDGRQFVSQNQLPEILGAVEAAGLRRGMPLSYPLLDLEDQVSLTPDRLWRLDEQQIFAASERYNPDSILVGRLTQTSRGEWQSDWSLFHQNRTQVYDSRDSSVDAVIAVVLDQVADYYFSQYGVERGLGGSVLVDVGGVDNFADYIDVLKYIEDLAIVRKVDLIEVFEDRLLINVQTEGERKLFQETLALGNKLAADNRPVQGVVPNIDVMRLYLK